MGIVYRMLIHSPGIILIGFPGWYLNP